MRLDRPMDKNEIREQARRHNVVIKDETTSDKLVTEDATKDVETAKADETIKTSPVAPTLDSKMDMDGFILLATNMRREDQIKNHGYETHAWRNAAKAEQDMWIGRAKTLMNRK